MKAVIFVVVAIFITESTAVSGRHLFRNADANMDHLLEEKEFDMIFNHWDTNNDGKVDEQEFIHGWENDDWDDDVNVRLEFHIFDVNDDGFIQDDPDLKHLFKTFDTNANNFVDYEEFDDAWDLLFDD